MPSHKQREEEHYTSFLEDFDSKNVDQLTEEVMKEIANERESNLGLKLFMYLASSWMDYPSEDDYFDLPKEKRQKFKDTASRVSLYARNYSLKE